MVDKGRQRSACAGRMPVGVSCQGHRREAGRESRRLKVPSNPPQRVAQLGSARLSMVLLSDILSAPLHAPLPHQARGEGAALDSHVRTMGAAGERRPCRSPHAQRHAGAPLCRESGDRSVGASAGAAGSGCERWKQEGGAARCRRLLSPNAAVCALAISAHRWFRTRRTRRTRRGTPNGAGDCRDTSSVWQHTMAVSQPSQPSTLRVASPGMSASRLARRTAPLHHARPRVWHTGERHFGPRRLWPPP